MDDLTERFRGLDRIDAPDLWAEATTRSPAVPSEPSLRRRLGVIVFSAAIALAAFAIVVVAFRETGPSPGSDRRPTYVFSDIEAGPSTAEPQDLAVTFTVAWSGDVYPGVHRCGYRALAADGSVVGEQVGLEAWQPGRWYHDVPGDPEVAVSGEVWCEPERLDAPGVADGITPVLPGDVDPETVEGTWEEVLQEMKVRLHEWASAYSVNSMSEDELAANMVALTRAINFRDDQQHFTVTRQLMDRLHYLCLLLPDGHEFRGGEYCD
jgi:hypothetical protein